MQVEFNRLRAFQSFDTIDDLNRSIRAFLYRNKHALSENAIRLYRLLAQHSVKIPGVSFASTAYWADKLSVSRRTVFRLLKRLEALGAIERRALHREDGGRAQSAIIILPYVSQGVVIEDASQGAADEKPHDEKAEAASDRADTGISNGVISDREKERNNVSADDLDYTYTPGNVPRQFVNAVKPFFRSANEIYRLWGTIRAAAKRIGTVTVPVDLAVDAFKQTVFAYKAGRVRKDFGAYLYGTITQMIAAEIRRQAAANRRTLFDYVV
nr:hypothetical protein [Bacillota bacterium]